MSTMIRLIRRDGSVTDGAVALGGRDRLRIARGVYPNKTITYFDRSPDDDADERLAFREVER